MGKFVINASGQAGNGKDVVANYIAEKLNKTQHWVRSSFASAVKQIFMDAFNVDFDFIEQWKRIDEAPPGFLKNVRKSLQFIGDGFRQIQDDIWIKLCLRNKDNQVISDGRYINEAKQVKLAGGFNILVWRPGSENNDPNPSESQIKPIMDYCSKNIDMGMINHKYLLYPPEGLQYYDFFLINNTQNLNGLYEIIDKNLLPEILDYFNLN